MAFLTAISTHIKRNNYEVSQTPNASLTVSMAILSLSKVIYAIDLDPISHMQVTTATANGTYNALLVDDVILQEASSSNATINLPSAAAAPGKVYEVKRINSTSPYTITLAPNGSDTIEGAASRTLYIQNDSVKIVSNGVSDWLVLDRRSNQGLVAQMYFGGASATWTRTSGTLGAYGAGSSLSPTIEASSTAFGTAQTTGANL